MLYVFMDLDATVCDAGKRIRAAGPEPARHDKATYLNWVHTIQNEQLLESDKAVPGMAALCLTLYHNTQFFYLTGREERWRNVSVKWLEKNGFPPGRLIMRPDENWSSMADFKELVIRHTVPADAEVIVFDDDERGELEAVCKRNNWTLLKARSGGQI